MHKTNVAFAIRSLICVFFIGFAFCSDDDDKADTDREVTGSGDETYTLTINLGGEGTGKILIDGSECIDAPCSLKLSAGSAVEIAAEPTLESSFVDDGSICGGFNTCMITMDSDKEVNFKFEVAGKLLAQEVIAIGAEWNFPWEKAPINRNGAFVKYEPVYDAGQSGERPFNFLKYSNAGLLEAEFVFSPALLSRPNVIENDVTAVALDKTGDLYVAWFYQNTFNGAIHPFRTNIFKLDGTSGGVIWEFELAFSQRSEIKKIFVNTENKVLWELENNNASPNLEVLLGGIPTPIPSQTRKIVGGLNEFGGLDNHFEISERAVLLTFGDNRLITAATPLESKASFAQVFSDDGTYLESVALPPNLVSITPLDNGFLCFGSHVDGVTLGGQTIFEPASIAEVYKIKLDNDLNYVGGEILATGVDLNAFHSVKGLNDNIFLVGGFKGTGLRLNDNTLAFYGDNDVFVAGFSPIGEHRFSRSFGGPHSEYPRHIRFDASGSLSVIASGQISTELGPIGGLSNWVQMTFQP